MKIDFIDGYDEDIYRAVNKGLTDFSVPVLGPDLPWTDDKFCFEVKDDNGTIIGGMVATINWRWCYIKLLWVDERYRGHGYGKEMMVRAEDHARKNNCIGMHVHTLSYQVPSFYEHMGFVKFGQLDNYPPGHHRVYYKKDL